MSAGWVVRLLPLDVMFDCMNLAQYHFVPAITYKVDTRDQEPLVAGVQNHWIVSLAVKSKAKRRYMISTSRRYMISTSLSDRHNERQCSPEVLSAKAKDNRKHIFRVEFQSNISLSELYGAFIRLQSVRVTSQPGG